jgi:ubiquinone biosynthesis monooxygenase Coq6
LVRKKLMPDTAYHSREYGQMGVVGTVTFAEPFPSGNATAFQKFLPTGPIALLPLSNNKSSLVWTLPPKTAKDLVKFDPKSFAKILNSNLSNRKHSELIDAAVAEVRKWLPSGKSSQKIKML